MQKVIIFNGEFGMHIRLASKIAMEISAYSELVDIIYNNRQFNAKSILGLTSSQIQSGDEFTIKVTGNENRAAEIINKIVSIIKEDKI